MERYVNVNGNGDWELDTGLLDGGQEIVVHQELDGRPNSEEVRRNVVQLPALRSTENRCCKLRTRQSMGMGGTKCNSKCSCTWSKT